MSKHKKSFSGNLDFLSNMYMCDIALPSGRVYTCAESYYLSFKTTNLEIRKKIHDERMNGYEVKALFKNKPFLIRPNWNDIRLQIMINVLIRKFENKTLRFKLQNIDDSLLVEHNTWGDTYYGICNGKGENYLGRALKYIKYRTLGLEVPEDCKLFNVLIYKAILG